MKPIKVKWDDESNPDDTGWVYLDWDNNWQAIPGPTGRDRDATPQDLAAEIGYGIDVHFDDVECMRRGLK